MDHPRALARRLSAAVDTRHSVAVAAVLAVLLRLPGMTRAIRPDEAGFLLVARTWAPDSDSVYGRYFVDRHPLLIGVVWLVDLVGGPRLLRLVGALGCAAAVLLAARIGRTVGTVGAGRWAAVVVAALTANPLIDAVAVKGELLALPLVLLAIWCALLAVRTDDARRATALALAAGVAATTAVCFKQSLVGGLTFSVVLFVSTTLWGPTTRRRLLGLVGGLAAGAAVPVLGTVGWARATGVDLGAVAYAVVGFRADASRALSAGTSDAPVERLGLLVLIAAGAGILAVLGGFVVHFRGEWRHDRATATATGVLLAVELAGLIAGGSYWRDYLFPLVPVIAISVALLTRRQTRRGARMRAVVLLCAASTAISLVVWAGLEADGRIGYTEVRTGAAVAEAARPGDTLVVFGGRADVQLSSGLLSPYRYLWSLPMRTLDPGYAQLRALMTGPDAPDWVVEWVSFTAWGAEAGPDLRRLVSEEYDEHGTGCGGAPVWLRRGLARPALTPSCG